MAGEKALWLLAGGNGAGKSTFYRLFLEPDGVEFVNADVIERGLDATTLDNPSYEASRLAQRRVSELLASGRSFCFETVFSHESKMALLLDAKNHGYVVNLVLIHLQNTALNVARVQQRVSEGGHNVPEDKITSRVPRTLELMRQAAPYVDAFMLFDNSSSQNPYQRVAIVEQSVITMYQDPLPTWAADVLGELQP